MNTIGKLPATTQDVETAVEHAMDTLALMINEGFKTTASKEDLTAVTTRLDGIDSRLDRIEHLLLAKQEQRLNDLETRMKNLEGALPSAPQIRKRDLPARTALYAISAHLLPGFEWVNLQKTQRG
jgi:uncharacterized protein (DUF885 family)